MLDDNQPSVPLMELFQHQLDAATLATLSADIAGFTRLIAVLPKYAQHQHTDNPDADIPLQQALTKGIDALHKGSLRGLQIRYIYENEEWWDTLIHGQGTCTLTRVCHGAITA